MNVINFSSLEFEEVNEPSKSKAFKESKSKITAEALGIPKKLNITEAKQRKDELHKIEPGYKTPVLSVGRIIGTWCEHCEDTTMQVLKFDESRLRCLDCKKDRKLKQ
jgi:hypothetical protein